MKRIKTVTIIVTIMLMMLALPMGITATAATSSWDGTTITQPTSMKTIDGVYYYEISTAEELAYIAKTGGDWLGYNYILANDITLNSVELTYDANGNLTVNASTLNQWTPINGFKGIFNGNGHTISGVYVNTSSSAGFFTSFNGDLYNLTIENSYVKGTSSVGGMFSSVSKVGGKIENAYYDGAVVGTSNVGGLIGSANCTYLKNSGNYGDVWGTGTYVAGLSGSFSSYGISNCFNEGNVYSTGDYVSGITGNISNYSISNTINRGNITGRNYVSGIVSNTRYSSISSCGNTGNITGNNYVGGICAYNGTYTYETSIGSCYNTGVITGTTYVGGIIGYLSDVHLSNNYNVGDVAGTENVGGVAGYSDTIWGKGTVSNCVYMKTETINATLKGFGNADDVNGVVNAKDDSFFCVNSDKTLNKNGHTYSSTVPCDATCDTCGYERTVTHTYDNVKYDSDKHWYECDCGEKKADSEASHTGGTATCISKAKCSVCKQSYGSLSEHNFNENAWGYKKTDGHAHACQTSGCYEHDTVVVHTSSGAATEDVAETCTECGYIISPALGHKKHTAKTEWITDDKYHWHECTGCEGQQLDKSSHKDLDNNAKCDTCGATVPVGTIGEPDEDVNSDGDGLPGGAIAGIAVGSIAVVGIGGFSLIWFVIKKKSWADLLAIFKK